MSCHTSASWKWGFFCFTRKSEPSSSTARGFHPGTFLLCMAVQHAPQRHEIRHRPECVGICISEMYFLRGSCIHSIAMLAECLDLLDEKFHIWHSLKLVHNARITYGILWSWITTHGGTSVWARFGFPGASWDGFGFLRAFWGRF